jgi:hypothetical protein
MSVNSTWLALNTLRVLSIISLMLVIATCVIVNIKGFPNLGQSNTIFQFLNRCVFALVSIVLIFAEFGWPKRLFYWFPMLDENHSWTFFGFLQIIIGSLVLGYDSGINSLSFLGYSLFIFVVVPGWLVFLIGIIYMLVGSFGGVKLKEMRRLTNTSQSDVKQRPPSYTV